MSDFDRILFTLGGLVIVFFIALGAVVGYMQGL